MFTGIVQAVAQIASIRDRASIRTFEIDFPEGFIDGLEVGGSVSIDGVCLTATEILSPDRVSFDAILQSLAVTTLSAFEVGATVNAERAARDGAEIGGHPLSGHIDFSTEIEVVSEVGGNKALRVHTPEAFRRYIFPKGYIAVNGASLTVSECNKLDGWFEVWLIPETRRATNLDAKAVGDKLNIEIERGTQVVVDTVRDTLTEALGNLKPALEGLLAERFGSGGCSGSATDPGAVPSRLMRTLQKPTAEIYLLRHGETEWNAEGRFQGHLDSPLTSRGIAQARAAAQRLTGVAHTVDAMFSSPLGRARQTADILRSLATYPSVQWDGRLQEVSVGSWDGLTHIDINACWPGLLHGASPFDWFFRSPDGESYDAVAERVLDWLADLSGTVIAVSHGLLSRIIRGVYLDLPQAQALQLPVPQDVIWHLRSGTIDILETE